MAEPIKFARSSLPAGVLPRGLSRVQAAEYVGVGTTKFDELVSARRMPAPRKIDGRKVWDVREIDLAFEDLPIDHGIAPKNSWDDV